MNFKIEKNISVPERKTHVSRFKCLAHKMEEGDSVLVDNFSAVTSLRYNFKKTGHTTIYRTVPEIGYRVWKIKALEVMKRTEKHV